MKIKNYELNKIKKDEFGRISGILALDKPAGITSHDLVDRVRKKLKIRRVGHAGALDPFATGLMIILVGKATKLSNHFLNMNKEYEFEVLLGVATETCDPEGKVTKVRQVRNISKNKMEKILKSFTPAYRQLTPIFSSIKVNGIRLRELARASREIKKFKRENKTFATFVFNFNNTFYNKRLKRKLEGKKKITIEIPKRKVEIFDIKLLKFKTVKGGDIKIKDKRICANSCFKSASICAPVSKGTYIRQLAEDIGERLGNIPAMLYVLERTKVGNICKKDIIKL